MGSRLLEKASGKCSLLAKKGLATLLSVRQTSLAGGSFRNSSPNTRPNPTPALEYVVGEEEKGQESIT